MLEGLNFTQPSSTFAAQAGDQSLLSVELDCCVIPVRNQLKLIQTTDFFYPIVDNPYTMGWITCCNVLSDLFAMGVVDCQNMLLLLGIPQEMSEIERQTSSKLLMEGFRDCAYEAGTFIRGGQTVFSPWLMVGGVATSVCTDSEFIMPNQVMSGDKLVLTKPLGTQVAALVHQWAIEGHKLWFEKAQHITSHEEVEDLFETATVSMSRLNRTAARLMHKYGAHGCTDITGFGLLGHAENLAKVQTRSNLCFRLHSLPCLTGALKLSKGLDDRFKLLRGLSPETSGGLLIALPAEKAEEFCREFNSLNGSPAWIVGDVVEAETKGAVLISEPNLIEVNHSVVRV